MSMMSFLGTPKPRRSTPAKMITSTFVRCSIKKFSKKRTTKRSSTSRRSWTRSRRISTNQRARKSLFILCPPRSAASSCPRRSKRPSEEVSLNRSAFPNPTIEQSSRYVHAIQSQSFFREKIMAF